MQVSEGQVLANRYKILRKLGEGGMAEVYEAHDDKFSARVALKIARASAQDFERSRVRFRREARVGYLLGKAPGFVRALDWGILDDQTLYMAMDLIPVARPIRLQVGPREGRLRTLLRAAHLVRRLHEHEIVHRDIKPENFLLDAKGQLHLSDFGTARELGKPSGDSELHQDQNLTQLGAIMGTPLYMPPEQFHDASSVDGRADVYALGVMLYAILTNRYPYEGESPIQIMSNQVSAMHGEGGPPLPCELDPKVPRALSEVCMRGLALGVNERPDSITFARELERLLGASRSRREPRRGPRASASGRAVRQSSGSHRLERPSPSPPPPAAKPPTRVLLEQNLGLNEEGFVAWEQLCAANDVLGGEQLAKVIGPWPALRVRSERPVAGKTRYVGMVVFVCPRKDPEASEVRLGRTLETDLTVQLASMSKAHARFVRTRNGWSLEDLGSSNGTELDGAALEAHKVMALTDRSLIRFAQHLTLEFLTPSSLVEALAQPPEGDASATTLRGVLAKDELVELLQMIEFNAKTGQLQILGDQGEAWLTFQDGRLRGASDSHGKTGEAAVGEVFRTKGRFNYVSKVPSDFVPDIDIAVSRLLLDVLRREDESQQPG